MNENWVAYGEGPVQGARELLRQLEEAGIEAQLGPAAKKACCGGGGCGCSAKVQVMLHPNDVERVAALMRDEWMEALKAEGTLQAGLPVLAAAPADAEADSDEVTCPACNTKGKLVEGACSDCGLQLE
jgi:hypothetical protein